MASNSSTTTPDTLVTVKISIGGNYRKFKVPLRDLGPSVLPGRLHLLLAIPSNVQVVFERYSDSAAAFILLDPSDPAVYKQLHRAAKAKLKLRLRATLFRGALEQPPRVAGPGIETTGEQTSDDLHRIPALLPRELQRACQVPQPSWAAAPSRSLPLVPGSLTSPMTAPVSSLDDPCPPCGPALTPNFAPGSKGPLKSADPPCYAAFSTSSASTDDVAHLAQARYLVVGSMNETSPSAEQLRGSSYAVYCNACDAPIVNEHYHCSICADGDFDLCCRCVSSGRVCEHEDHWLIKRFIKDGLVLNSTTEKVRPRKNDAMPETSKLAPVDHDTLEENEEQQVDEDTNVVSTCNHCLEEFTTHVCVECTVCDRYTLCTRCLRMKHGHNPSHAFKSADPATEHDHLTKALCVAGRNLRHHAICDGCDKTIVGVRHKCVDCPDWDYCSACVQSAPYIHPCHRFVPVYESLTPRWGRNMHHYGKLCDGPLCTGKMGQRHIVGDRYKCAVCHDTDFCANCEASPINLHNKTHPLIKFKTPVRNVTVCTLNEKPDGSEMPPMGDLQARERHGAAASGLSSASTNTATRPQTVVDLKPTDDTVVPTKQTAESSEGVARDDEPSNELNAHFVCDAVPDGTRLPPNHVFRQTWTISNPGPSSWPKGCSVKFVGGDNMRNIDTAHPVSVADLERSVESNACPVILRVAERWCFSVTMKTPNREGKCISYWRLTAPDGVRFGRKLWCDVDVCRDALLPGSVQPAPTLLPPVASSPDEPSSSSSSAPTRVLARNEFNLLQERTVEEKRAASVAAMMSWRKAKAARRGPLGESSRWSTMSEELGWVRGEANHEQAIGPGCVAWNDPEEKINHLAEHHAKLRARSKAQTAASEDGQEEATPGCAVKRTPDSVALSSLLRESSAAHAVSAKQPLPSQVTTDREGGAVPETSPGRTRELQDYQLQLMMLEQQNLRRLILAKRQQDSQATTDVDSKLQFRSRHPLTSELPLTSEPTSTSELDNADVPAVEHIEDVEKEKKEDGTTHESTMIFPKLDKESSVASKETGKEATAEPTADDLISEVESLSLEDDETDAGFLTDEEYDILDASDEEYSGVTQKPAQK